MNDHTPTPWKLTIVGKGFYYVERDRELIAQIDRHSDSAVNRANAAFIVRACNTHDVLVGLLETCIDCMDEYGAETGMGPTIQRVRAILAEAEGA